jgi:GT2 family glycosyltransferase
MKGFEMKEKVCAVVVTYNRKDLLIECLQGLLGQTRSLDTILIVDNASTDQTAELLLDKGYISSLPPEVITEPYVSDDKAKVNSKKNRCSNDLEVIYVRMHENTGGAGGFHYGQKRAYELGFEWLWLMDDDGVPALDCLEKILNKSKLAKLKATNPLVINKTNTQLLSFGLSASLMRVDEAEKYQDVKGLIMNLANPFNGTLLNRELISKIGFIKKEMFIWGDEVEYFKRMNKFGFSYGTVVSAIFHHPTSNTVYKEKIFGLLKVATKPMKLEMNFYRNQGYLNRRYGNIFSHTIVLKNVTFFLLEGDLMRAILTLRYYLDGCLDKFELPNIR